MQTKHQENLERLIDDADENIKVISKYIHRFLYQVFYEFDDISNENEHEIRFWCEDVIVDINDLIEYGDRSRWLDRQYLIQLKLILEEHTYTENKRIINNINFNYN